MTGAIGEIGWTRHCSEPAAERVKAATGRDIWHEIGGCPRSWREAADLYRRLGVRDLAGAVSSVLGPAVDPLLARRGDIAMVDGALGIVRGDWVECLDQMQPLSRALRAWRV